MVIGAFPVAKLGLLAVKQISKPIANLIKSKAKDSPVFRNYICMPPAQFYNWMEVKTKMWALNLGKPVQVPPLNESMAIELGANLLGEFIIFVVGAGVLIFEYARQSSNEARKQDQLKQEKSDLTGALTEMGFRLERQDAQIREMTRVLADLESRSLFKWHKETLPDYEPFDPNKPNQSSSSSNNNKNSNSTKTYVGLYNPEQNMVYRAINYLETHMFAQREEASDALTNVQNVPKSKQSQVNSTAQLHYYKTPQWQLDLVKPTA